jgi:hypothetical protein
LKTKRKVASGNKKERLTQMLRIVKNRIKKEEIK